MFSITFNSPSLALITKLATISSDFEVKPVTEEKPAKAKAEPKPKEVDKDKLEQVKATTTALAKISRDTAIATLKQFDASSVPTLKPEHYDAFLKTANDILENNKGSEGLV